MRERDRLEHKKYFEQEQQREKEEQERKEAPIRAAEQQLNQTAVQLAKVERENILNLKDEQLYVSPELANARMSWDEANKFNAEQSQIFVDRCPEYYPCDENLNQLVSYFTERNNTQIIDAAMWERAYRRLDSLGLIVHRPERPAPAPEPEPVEEQEPEERPRTVGGWIGFDPETGEQREYNEYEVDRMDADTYRKVFKLRSMYNVWIDAATGREVRQPT